MKTRRIGLLIIGTSVAVAGVVVLETVRRQGTLATAEERFSGGALHGYGYAVLVQTPPVVIPPHPRFSGSSFDGFSDAHLWANEPVPIAHSSRFSGGGEDGFDSFRIGVIEDVPHVPGPRFSGGALDGYSGAILFASGGIGEESPRHSGGSEDGYAFAVLWATGGLPHVSEQRFFGGPEDGYAFAGYYPSGGPGGLLSPRFFGGGLDGFDARGIRIPMSEIAPDTDADGIADWWEERHYGGPTSAVASAVPDASGMTNLEKYIAGLIPGDDRSIFIVSETQAEPMGGDAEFILLAWQTVRGRVYRVYASHDLAEPWPDVPVVEVFGDGRPAVYAHMVADETSLFFRLTVSFIGE